MTDERDQNQENRGEAGEFTSSEQSATQHIPEESQSTTGAADAEKSGLEGSAGGSPDSATGRDSEPPAGTTTPGTLFATEEMEDMKSGETKKKEAEEKKRKEAASQSAAAAENKYPEGTEFRYSGHTRVLPQAMTETAIFKWVADDFPEVEKDRYTLRYDQSKGRLVPIPKAQKKGSGIADTLEVNTLPPAATDGNTPPVYRLLCVDGVYEVRTSLAGTYVVRLESPATLAEGYYPALPKAPARLLAEIVRIFKDRPDTEALIDIVYDRRNATFRLVCNQKRASAGEVEYQPLPDDDNFVLYAEIHSHHRMSAFFSATDDYSEKKTGVYGVMGRITDDVPEARFRYSCGGHFREIPAENLFHDPSSVAATVRRPSP